MSTEPNRPDYPTPYKPWWTTLRAAASLIDEAVGLHDGSYVVPGDGLKLLCDTVEAEYAELAQRTTWNPTMFRVRLTHNASYSPASSRSSPPVSASEENPPMSPSPSPGG